MITEAAAWTLPSLAQACVRQPLSRPVPADDRHFLARKGILRLAFRTARRRFLLEMSGQLPLLRSRIDPTWRKALWIHDGMPQIGDAMMDLAPRSLLADNGIRVDLLAAPHIAELFAGDPWLRRTLSRAEDAAQGDYDFVIVMSHDRKSWRLKRLALPRLPWVSLHKYYGGPDFHRARFASQRIADLLDVQLTDEALALHSAQKLRPVDDAVRWAAEQAGDRPSVTLALGGVHAERTYRRWPSVVEHLASGGAEQLILVGSESGRSVASQVVQAYGHRIALLDFVGRTDLHQVHALLARSHVAVCADGGLMHLAVATPARLVSLFNCAIDPSWRLPLISPGTSLVSVTTSVDDIAPVLVAQAALAELASRRRSGES